MKRYTHSSKQGRQYRALCVVIGVAVNVLLAYISFQVGMPVYLDTIGTITATAVGGLVPGIMTAIATNTLCTLFNPEAPYFGVVNVLLALFTASFLRRRSFRKFWDVILFVAVTGLISGCLSGLIQWSMLGGPQSPSLRSLMSYLTNAGGIAGFLLFLFLNFILNTFDKAISLILSKILLHLIPDEAETKIRNSGWRQRPLSPDEMKQMESMSGDSRFSLNRRMLFILLFVTLSITAVLTWIGVQLYFTSAKAEKTKIAQNAAKFAAEVVDPEMLDDYIASGKAAPGYAETEDLLYKIRENASDVEYLYVIQIRKDGCYFAFDLDTENVEANAPGYVSEFEDAFKPYLPALFAGEEIEPIESNDVSGWVVTAYYPIRDADGNCRGYAGADVSLTYMAGYMRDFIIRVLVLLAGFLILTLVYALWTTGIYIVYPINTIVDAVETCIAAGTDQEKMDDSVRKLRSIDIRTRDEVERLYHAICDMAANQSEQMRSIRRFSENTAKMQDGLIVTMADLVESRDSDTGAHVQKTAAYVKIIVEGLKRKGYYAEKITPKFMSDVVRSAPLHDVGKINIPDNVLNKPGKLTDEEYEIIKTHTIAGRMIMEKAISTVEGENYLKEARNMAAYHHERWDGKGYPEGLHGEVIPLAARIMAVADVFDALASPRVYKPAFPLEKALSIIQEGAGTQFDPKCVEVFMESLPEVKEVLRKYQQNV